MVCEKQMLVEQPTNAMYKRHEVQNQNKGLKGKAYEAISNEVIISSISAVLKNVQIIELN